MSPNPTLSPQLIGQAEKTLNAILERHLSGAGLSEPQWITLTLAVMGGDPIGRDQLARRVASAAKFSEADVQTRITELADARLLDVADDEVAVTDGGKQLHARIRATNNELTERLWRDLPAADLDTAGRVLAVVLERANAELARAEPPPVAPLAASAVRRAPRPPSIPISQAAQGSRSAPRAARSRPGTHATSRAGS